MKVCLGGTFSIIHEGHEALLKKAFECGEVTIGMTSDRLAREMGKEVASYNKRKERLERFIAEKFGRSTSIYPLDNPYGTAIDEDFDAIVVSPETVRGADEINRIRKAKGLKKLEVILVPFVLAEDGIPVSSSRIRREEIKGKKRLRELFVKIEASDRKKIEEAKHAFKKFLPHIEIKFEGRSAKAGADYTVEFSEEGCIIKDSSGYATSGRNAEEALSFRFNH